MTRPTLTSRPTWDQPDADPLADIRDIAQMSYDTYPERWEQEMAGRQRVEDLAFAIRERKQPVLTRTMARWLSAFPFLAAMVWTVAKFAGSIT